MHVGASGAVSPTADRGSVDCLEAGAEYESALQHHQRHRYEPRRNPKQESDLPSSTRSTLFGDLRRAYSILGGALVVLWLILLCDSVFFGGHLLRFGILPRSLPGLRGIVFAPFLHVSASHLLANSIGLVLLGGLVLLRNEADFWIVTLVGAIVGGLGTWLFARAEIHVGASGVIFAYFGYLVSTGFFERRFGAIAISVLAVLSWGSLIFGILPGQRGISWESHLFGLAAGGVSAWLIALRRRRP